MRRERGVWAATGVGVLLVVLAACTSASDPESLTTRCEGSDMIYVLDDPNNGSDLFVVPGHPVCERLETR